MTAVQSTQVVQLQTTKVVGVPESLRQDMGQGSGIGIMMRGMRGNDPRSYHRDACYA
eukprot:CAMPEP_0174369310 /NCGR_PEP_ID=MMETSP0811_2-20130205/91999_1 /TAXON_ID=73025 ORGANISM="Eutreptiella gymnastica-like, Strain CCMP1594" /NCGR_SAMPLE_ID=MMETSP0811_2 /ASSEMBLY_ACC=CAM_ASM_000667 /LENGTH=56 /DNA_ID=CAMNT_0015513605 /DNA_START=66 /DNA_END=236 /DNA_ORIENTATION=-